MPADELRDRLHGHVGAECQRTLVEGRRKRVVDGQDPPRLPRGGADDVDVGHGQQRVRGRLEPDQVGRGAGLDPARGVGDRDALYRPATAPFSSVGEPRRALVAVVGQRHDRARRELVEDRGDSCHARGEGDRRSAFEAADEILEGFPPRRAIVARVGAAVAEHEVRGGPRWHVERRARAPVASRRHHPRFDRSSVSQAVFARILQGHGAMVTGRSPCGGDLCPSEPVNRPCVVRRVARSPPGTHQCYHLARRPRHQSLGLAFRRAAARSSSP